MSKIKIVVDSTSGIDLMENPIDAEVLRLFVIFDGKQYRDGLDLTPEEFYEMIENNKSVLPSTSQPTIGGTVEQFERLKEEGYEELIVFTISSGLSGTYWTTESAKNMVEGLKIYTVDSRKTVMPLYSMAEQAYELVQQGKSAQEIVDYIESIKNDYKIYLAVGDLTLLQKNGRLSTASAMIGSILKIKPLLMIDDEGVIKSVEKIRTMKKALKTMVDAFVGEGEVSEANILHSNSPELAEEFRTLLAEKKPELKDIPMFQLTPVIGSHLGRGTVGITFRRGSN